jgi:hypothetical protein
METFYLGGYYLIRQTPIDFGEQAKKTVYTASNCINDSLLNDWGYSWVGNRDDSIEDIMNDLKIDSDKVTSIREWVDAAFEDKKIGWVNLFSSYEAVTEYRKKFFSHLLDLKIIAIYFSEFELLDLSVDFKPPNERTGAIGLYENLIRKIPENDLEREALIGFDIIGIEMEGSFHTFYCHDLSRDLAEKFNLQINEYGLFDKTDNWKSVTDYMNDEENGFEPVPWFVCKTKLITE